MKSKLKVKPHKKRELQPNVTLFFSVSGSKIRTCGLLLPNKTSVSSIIEYYDIIIDELKAKGKLGNADNYHQSKVAFTKLSSANSLKFEDITVSLLNNWEKMLSQTCSGNGISNYMRTLRALFNKAISEDICSPDIYPFKTKHNSYNISKLKTETEIRKRVKNYTKHINRNLKKLGRLAKIPNPERLTTYEARHSWATTMKRKGVSTSLISEAMHHSDERTTQIYLDSFESDRVDEINEKLL